VFAFAHLLLPFLGSILNAVVTFATGQFSGSRSHYVLSPLLMVRTAHCATIFRPEFLRVQLSVTAIAFCNYKVYLRLLSALAKGFFSQGRHPLFNLSSLCLARSSTEAAGRLSAQQPGQPLANSGQTA